VCDNLTAFPVTLHSLLPFAFSLISTPATEGGMMESRWLLGGALLLVVALGALLVWAALFDSQDVQGTIHHEVQQGPIGAPGGD
jgi:hypothetical protein